MKKLPILARSLAFVGVAALLSAARPCRRAKTTASVPIDYRLRHPIAVREAETLTVSSATAAAG